MLSEKKAWNRAAITGAASDDSSEMQVAIYAYDLPVRLWHWINALCILVLCVTGYLIGSPPSSVAGEASSSYGFGLIRFSHFVAAQIFAYALIGRMAIAFFGSSTSRELFVPRIWQREWWNDLWGVLLWYLFLSASPKRFIGHNPLAQLIMFLLFVMPAMLMIATGTALYIEAYGLDHPLHFITDAMLSLFSSSQDIHTAHHLTMWVIVCFAILHIYIAVREEIMSRQSMISTMISGWRMFKN